MIEPPYVTSTEEQQTATVAVKCPRSEIQELMGPAIQEVLAVLAAQGLTPAGPLFSNHFEMHEDIFDFEVGYPVNTAVQSTGRVHPSVLREAPRVVQTIYHGPYEELGEGWGEFMDWIRENNLQYAPGVWERYLVGPETTDDPSQWRTELNRRLLD